MFETERGLFASKRPRSVFALRSDAVPWNLRRKRRFRLFRILRELSRIWTDGCELPNRLLGTAASFNGERAACCYNSA